ncbi:MAG: NAD(P)H-hydrate dehydratase [Steroidobacteraceae bacterium]
METLPAEVYSAAQVRAMDRHAIEKAGIPGYTLMQRAGSAALAAVQRHWPDASKLAILCGAGNNGGDGYVLARLARAAGLEVRVAALTDPHRLGGDSARAFTEFAAQGGRYGAFDAAALAGSDLVVDALLGTGIDRRVEGAFRDCIEQVNRAGLPVLALDIPSGLDADTGFPQGAAICATRTIVFIALKSGLFLGVAPDYVGRLDFASLDIPAAARESAAPVLRRMVERLLADALPPRRPSAHKGDHGRVVVIGGLAMAGAARLAGEAALRTGAGLVAIATSAANAGAIVGARPELICPALHRSADLAPMLRDADAVAVGPGLGLDRRAGKLLEEAIKSERPLVVDADALTILARRPRRHADWILTPHPGEAARLLGTDAASVQRDRHGSAREIAARFGGVCVLKGAGTLVQPGSELTWICDRGNPAMATAGSGDVLTGIVAALLAGGCGPGLAAAAGVLLHAEAGDRAARGGARGVIAGDLIAELHDVVNSPWK